MFGINDKGESIGVENHERRINSANIQDFLNSNRSIFFNNDIPEVNAITLKDYFHDIDVLEIKSTFNVPYFLIKQYPDGNKIVRSGHIYTRSIDRNTPINECASPNQAIKLWEKRFGRLEKHLDKFLIYLDDLSNWKTEQLFIENRVRYYYDPDPAFTIEREFIFEDHYGSPRYQALPYDISSMYRGRYKCLLNQIAIDTGEIYYIDYARSIISQTKYYQFQLTSSQNIVFSMDYYLANSIEYKLIKLFKQEKIESLEYGLHLFFDQTIIFDTQAEVDEFINYVKLKIQDIITEVEESSGIKFEDAPYGRRKHDLFRIQTGRVLNELHRDFRLKNFDNI